jgi:hypothetical protein
MSTLKQVMIYIVNSYKHSQSISVSRLSKTVYLADWQAALKLDRQLTNINWDIRFSGPFAPEIESVLTGDADFQMQGDKNYINKVQQIALPNEDIPVELTPFELRVLDKVLRDTVRLNWNDFLNYVYDTYPVKIQRRTTTIDLVAVAKEYKNFHIDAYS